MSDLTKGESAARALTAADVRALVLETVRRRGSITFMQLNAALSDQVGGREPDRAIDRALQALRKRGALAFDRRTGWTVKESTDVK